MLLFHLFFWLLRYLRPRQLCLALSAKHWISLRFVFTSRHDSDFRSLTCRPTLAFDAFLYWSCQARAIEKEAHITFPWRAKIVILER